MNLQLSLFPVDEFISKKKPILYKQEDDIFLNEVNDSFPNYHLYPSEDDEPMAQDATQAMIMVLLKNALDYTFSDQKDVFVGLDLFLYISKNEVKAPDILVARGVKYEPKRKSFIIEKEKKASSVVMEVLSSSNYADKKYLQVRFDFYAKAKIEEFWVINTQPTTSIDTYFLVNNSYYHKILDFPNFYDDYLQCSISVENNTIIIKDKSGNVIDEFTTQIKQRKKAEEEKMIAEKAKEIAEKLAKQAEELRDEAELAKKEAEKTAEKEAEARKEMEEKYKKMELELKELRNLARKEIQL